jgi:hypothetical protein
MNTLNRSWVATAFASVVIMLLLVDRLWAAPTLQWTPSSVVQFALPRSSHKFAVHFRSNENLSQVDVFVTPALNSVLSVRPTRLTKIVANKDYKLDLTLTAPSSRGVAFQGTIQLKMTQGTSATQSPALPITFVIHDKPVPPDPGEAGKATLEGIDSDDDGVRDDIQRWIVLTYVSSRTVQAALFQYSRAAQLFLINADNKDLARQNDVMRQRGTECLLYIRPGDGWEIRDEIRAQLLNTRSRALAYSKGDLQLSGVVSALRPPALRKQSCGFDPNSL